MKKGFPIKKDSFRFMTFKSPNHIGNSHSLASYIFHPDANKNIKHVTQKDGKTILELPKEFTPAKKYMDIANINPAMYDFAMALSKNKNQVDKVKRLKRPKKTLGVKSIQQVWNQLLYQVVNSESKYVQQACVQMLIADNFLEKTEKDNFNEIEALLRAKIVIPETVSNIIRGENGPCNGELIGVNTLGIADFRRVEQEVCCYVPGEVSHIENILAKEYKERSTRNLVRTELTDEESTSTEIEQLNDTTTTDRNELSSEIEKVLKEEESTNYGGSLGISGTAFGVTISAEAYADFSSSNSSNYSNKAAQEYAKEVTRRAAEKIIQKTTSKRTAKILKEFEENNKHGFDNRSSEDHVTGVYRWVDKVYTNRLINYGKRLMIEFTVPEPAKFFKIAMNNKKIQGGSNSVEVDPPKTLKELGINSATDISENNYNSLANAYGITLSAPPADEKIVNDTLQPDVPTSNAMQGTRNHSVIIPSDYEAVEVKGEYEYTTMGIAFFPISSFVYRIANVAGGMANVHSVGPQTISGTDPQLMINPTGNPMDVEVQFTRIVDYELNLEIKCSLKQAVYTAWQSNAYTQLQDAYNFLLQQYEQNTSEPTKEEEEEARRIHPKFHRIFEQRELKRLSIEMLTKPYCYDFGHDFYTLNQMCGDDQPPIPQLNLSSKLKDFGEMVRFFEQAMEWKIMSYLFYPYYYGKKCDWVELMNTENEDEVFQAFLQAGMARVVVPVRPEFVEAVLYYLETGKLWLGGDLVFDTDNALYLSIIEEMAEPEGVVEEEWETRVPTTLTIVQQNSAGLDESGLPCCHEEDENDGLTNIIEKTNVLQHLNTIN